jgi:16S rRNA (cytosine967-C5)-methyltransferase
VTDRQRALLLLQRIEREHLYASLLLIGETGFVRTLVLGVLRWRSRLDFVMATLARRSINRLDTAVVEVLRLGLYQLLYMDVAPYAAVSETVDLAPKRARGFVNAILRSATREKLPEPPDLPTRTAHPAWLIERWTRTYGAERAAKIAAANQELSYPDVLSLHGAVPPESVSSQLVPDVYRLHGSSAELDRREFHPMDEGSAVVAAIACAGGHDILDLTAAPGGKSLYMATHGARIVANDISIARLQPLTGRDVPIVVSDGLKPAFAKTFEVVLLDAPCSATGTIRKSPELKWRLRESDLAPFAELQKELLRSAMTLARNYVVYSTCSLEPEENDAQVESFLAEHPDFTLEPPPDGAVPAEVLDAGRLRVLPQRHGTDGAFAARMRRA